MRFPRHILIAPITFSVVCSAAYSQTNPTVFPTRAALSTAPTSLGVVILNEAGREGIFTWVAGDQHALVAADPQQGIVIAPASALMGSNGVWKRVVQHEVNICWFGAVADGTSGTVGMDNYPAIQAALNYLRLTSPISPSENDFRPTGTLYFPTGKYRVSKTLEITHTVRLLGDSTGGNGGEATQLLFPANVDGIIVQRFNTFGTDGDGRTRPAHGSGEGSIIEGLTVKADRENAKLASKACGFRLRARTELVRCSAVAFAQDGFYLGASLDANTHPLGSTSQSKLDSCTATGNGRHGFYFGGADSNAISVIAPNTVLNGQYGYYDESFLGVHFFGGHSASNGQLHSGLYPTTSIVYHRHVQSRRDGRWFVYNGKQEQAATTEPGTDDSVWLYKEPGGPDPNYPAWVRGGAYVSGGSACLNGGGSSHTGIYTEGGQGHLFIGASAQVRDGLVGADGQEFYGPGIYSKANQGAQEVRGVVRTVQIGDSRTLTSFLGGDISDGQVGGFFDTDSANHYLYRLENGEVTFSRNNNRLYTITSPTSKATYTQFGRMSPVADVFVPTVFALPHDSGPFGAHRIQAYASEPPKGTHFGSREVRWNDGTNPAYNDVDYWIWKDGKWVARP